MIDIRQQEEVFITVGNALDRKITAYAIGGTAMMLRGLKDATLDIDLVFESSKDRADFISTLEKLEAKRTDATLVYGMKKNTPILLNLGEAKFDLFLDKIITSTFSDKMKERAKQINEFGENLIVKVADPVDVIIMKSATSREKDLTDIAAIINKVSIIWDVLIDEARNQIFLGNEGAILDLGEKLEKLGNRKEIKIPGGILDRLYDLLKEQISKKANHPNQIKNKQKNIRKRHSINQ